jgi:broad specificity phosphatase PhoE
MSKQYVYLVRYGLTDPPLMENVGNYDSDIHEPIGVEHALAIANFLQERDANAKPSVVYSDPFLRCAHTANIIARTLICPHRIEEGVTEWMVPSLLVDKDGDITKPRTVEELNKIFPSIDTMFQSVNPVDKLDGAPTGAPHFVESEQALFERVACTLDRLLDYHHSLPNKNENLCIVSHAPCLQGMALILEDKNDPTQSSFGPWSLGGVTCFSRDICYHGNRSKWKCEFYSATDHLPEEYKDGAKGAWSLPSFVRK